MGARPVIALICLPQDPEDSLADYLERRGYEVREADEQWMAESLLSAGGIDVAVIGENYPASSGLDLLRRHGGEAGPSFVMVSGRADLIEKVLALEIVREAVLRVLGQADERYDRPCTHAANAASRIPNERPK